MRGLCNGKFGGIWVSTGSAHPEVIFGAVKRGPEVGPITFYEVAATHDGPLLVDLNLTEIPTNPFIVAGVLHIDNLHERMRHIARVIAPSVW